MKKLFSLCIIMLLLVTIPAVAEFKAGAAVRVITPDPLLPVTGGTGGADPATEAKGDLFARALVVEQGDTRVAFVNVDSLGFPASLCKKACAQIPGVPEANVLIGATHSHSAPDAYGFPGEDGVPKADLKYLDWVCTQIAEAVNEAVTKLEPAGVKINMDRIAEGIAYNYYAPKLYDPRCRVLQAVSNDTGKAIATLVNYAVHPEVIGSGQKIMSADLCAPLYDRIEAKGGGIAVFMNGALGGMVTADCREAEDSGKGWDRWVECQRIGNLLADEALRVIADAPLQEDPALYCASKKVYFPVESEGMKYILANASVKFNQEREGYADSRLNLVNIGTAQMLTIPGEALPNIGYYLKRNMPTEQPFLLGLTNDAFGYIIAKVDWASFERYNYITRTCLGEETGEIFMQEALAMIQAAPKPATLE